MLAVALAFLINIFRPTEHRWKYT